MTLEEAIKEANSRPTNMGLNYYVHKWGNGYAIAPTSYFKKFPDIEYVYSTADDLPKKEKSKRSSMITLIKKG